MAIKISKLCRVFTFLMNVYSSSRWLLLRLIKLLLPKRWQAGTQSRRVLFKPRPRPFPKQRLRSLTPSPLSSHNLMPEQKFYPTCDQTKSPFFRKFPLEIRQLIYYHVLGGITLHIVRLESR